MAKTWECDQQIARAPTPDAGESRPTDSESRTHMSTSDTFLLVVQLSLTRGAVLARNSLTRRLLFTACKCADSQLYPPCVSLFPARVLATVRVWLKMDGTGRATRALDVACRPRKDSGCGRRTLEKEDRAPQLARSISTPRLPRRIWKTLSILTPVPRGVGPTPRWALELPPFLQAPL